MVDQPTVVLTRFRLKHWWYAPLLWARFERVHGLIRKPGGLLVARLLMESPRCYMSMSIWSNPETIAESAIPLHVKSVHQARAWCTETWTTQWHLTRVSSSSRSWSASEVDWWALAIATDTNHFWPAGLTGCSGGTVKVGDTASG